MALCDFCMGEMTVVDSCCLDHLHRRGRPIGMVPYGRERRWPSTRGRCGDCGVRRGGWHHLGCDIQECPTCAGQLISCDCPFDEYGDDIDDDDDDDPWDDGRCGDEPIDVVFGGCGSEYPPGEFLGVDASGAVTERTTIAGIDVLIHHAEIPASDITTHKGIRVTTALRTVIDIAADTDPAYLPEMVDDALERGLFTVEEAYERLAQPDMATHRGADFVRRVLPPRP